MADETSTADGRSKTPGSSLSKLGWTSGRPKLRLSYSRYPAARMDQVRRDLHQIADWAWKQLAVLGVVPTILREPKDPKDTEGGR